MNKTVLYKTVLYKTVLYKTKLHYTVPCKTVNIQNEKDLVLVLFFMSILDFEAVAVKLAGE